MVKLKELLNEYGKKTSELVGTRKKVFGRIYQMQDEMAKGKFNPNNPQIHHNLGILYLENDKAEKAI